MQRFDVKAAMHLKACRDRLTKQQYNTLKGQILAGDGAGAMKGLRKLISKKEEKPMRTPPCKKNGIDCPKRCPGCQPRCKDYIDFRAGCDADNARRRAEVESTENVILSKRRMAKAKASNPKGR